MEISPVVEDLRIKPYGNLRQVHHSKFSASEVANSHLEEAIKYSMVCEMRCTTQASEKGGTTTQRTYNNSPTYAAFKKPQRTIGVCLKAEPLFPLTSQGLYLQNSGR